MAELRFVSHSEIGLVRKNNQDSGFASPTLLVVADGMGGAAAGDLASAVAIDTIKRIAPDAPPDAAQSSGEAPTAGEEMLEVLAGAIHKANDRIADLVAADYSLDGMGTTVTSAMFDGTDLGVAHIGDSRAYLLRDGVLERLTHDHSWVQSLVDEGKISLEEAAAHPHRSLLLKVLNGQGANDPDLTLVALRPGDRLMLCSDGVCGLVDDAVIEQALTLDTIDEALELLVSESLAEGGIDNITVIVADVVEADGTADTAVLGAAAERVIPAIATTARTGPPNLSEDTVVNLRPVRAATRPVDNADEARYNPVPPKRYRFVRPVVLILALLLVLGAGVGAAYAWTRTQYFVGADGQQVAIFRGLSQSVPGLRLSTVFEVQPLTVAELPPYYQERVRANIDVSSLESARQTVAELTETAQRCARVKPTPKPSPTPSPKPSQPPPTPGTARPSAPATASAGVTDSPAPTPTQPSC
jgi:serine/threonine protein phosphatase PrpC